MLRAAQPCLSAARAYSQPGVRRSLPSCAGAVLSTIAAVLVPQRDIMLGPVKTDTFFALICFALALWGIAQGAGSSALEALLADSVPTGLLGLRWVPLVLRCRLLRTWGLSGLHGTGIGLAPGQVARAASLLAASTGWVVALACVGCKGPKVD